VIVAGPLSRYLLAAGGRRGAISMTIDRDARNDRAADREGLELAAGWTPSSAALMRLRTTLAKAGVAISDLIVPPVCLSCQKRLGAHDSLCAACWRRVRFIRGPLCDRLGIPLPFDTGQLMVSGAALKDPPDWDRARAVAHFDQVVRDLIHRFKYGDRHDARRLFGRWLTVAGRELLADADVLIPVPLHPQRLLGRRFNQAAILAQEVARLSGVEVDALALRRVKPTPSQVELARAERRRNLAGAFQVSAGAAPRVEGRRVLVIDDVLTTGSTLAACSRVLKRAGATRVDCLALAMVTEESRVGV
jgi:ComF family protein